MKLQIDITKEILSQTKNCSTTDENEIGTNCAIGKAIHDIFPYSHVSRSTIEFFQSDDHRIKWLLGLATFRIQQSLASVVHSEKVKKFVWLFDQSSPKMRENMAPISFEVDIPDAVIETIDIEDVKRIINETSHLNLV